MALDYYFCYNFCQNFLNTVDNIFIDNFLGTFTKNSGFLVPTSYIPTPSFSL